MTNGCLIVSGCALCQQICKCVLMLDLHNAWLLGKWLIHMYQTAAGMFSYIQVFCLISLFYLYLLMNKCHSCTVCISSCFTHWPIQTVGLGFQNHCHLIPVKFCFEGLFVLSFPPQWDGLKGWSLGEPVPFCAWPVVFQSYCVTLTLNPNPEPKTLLLELSQMLFKWDLFFCMMITIFELNRFTLVSVTLTFYWG